MEKFLEVTPDGAVLDKVTGLAYGDVWKASGGWHGRTRHSREHGEIRLIRPTRREAAMAVAAAYVLGYES